MKKILQSIALGMLGLSCLAQSPTSVGRFTASAGPVGYNSCLTNGWPMNEGSGTTFHDAVGSDPMTINGTVTWQSNTGLTGTTPYFGGSGYAVGSTATPTNFTGTTPFSVAFWFADTAAASTSWVVGNSTFASPYLGWGVFINAPGSILAEGGYLIFDVIQSYSGNAIQVANSNGAPSSIPFYVVITYDGSKTAAGVKMYYNGLSAVGQQETNFDTFTGPSAASGLPIQVGEAPGGGIPFVGAITGLAVYNCALNPTDIATYAGRAQGIN